MLAGHTLHRLARTQNAADDIDVHHAGESRGGHFIDARGRIDHAGVVNKGTELAEGIRLLEQRENVGLNADIALHRDGLAVAAFDLRHDFVGRRLVAGVADDDLVAARCSGQRRGAADAAAASANKGALICQSKVHLKSPLICFV